MLSIPVGDAAVDAYLAEPQAMSGPVVVVRREVFGVTPWAAVNLRPAGELLVVAGGAMKAAGRGVIVILTSSGVREPIPTLAASSAMRAAVTSLAKTAAGELAPYGVRVLCVAPGRIDTQPVRQLDAAAAARQNRPVDEVAAASRSTIPMGRYGQPDEFGKVVSFLCSDDAVYMTGTTVSVDGGKSPNLLA